MVEKIHESDSFKKIEQNILNEKGQLERVLVGLYFARDVGHEYLATGDIEDLTDELGVRIAQSNVSHLGTAIGDVVKLLNSYLGTVLGKHSSTNRLQDIY